MSTVRLTVAMLLVAATALVAGATREAAVTPSATVVIPYALDGWTGVDLQPIDAELQRAIGADFVLNRAYASPGVQLELYVASYARQRPGTSIHSPLHCLPGTGWDILSNESVTVSFPDRTAGAVRRLLAQKGSSRVLILYWYSIHGRMIANEALSRWWLLTDRFTLGRNDGALVRLVVPVTDSEDVSQEHGVQFIRTLVPYLQARQE